MTDPRAPQPIDSTLGQRVRRAREHANLTLVELAGKLSISWQQLSKYENGTNRIAASRLVRISEVLSVPLASFLEGLGASDDAPEVLAAREAMRAFLADPAAGRVLKWWPRLGKPERSVVSEVVFTLAMALAT